jgi:hypothetical protein
MDDKELQAIWDLAESEGRIRAYKAIMRGGQTLHKASEVVAMATRKTIDAELENPEIVKAHQESMAFLRAISRLRRNSNHGEP